MSFLEKATDSRCRCTTWIERHKNSFFCTNESEGLIFRIQSDGDTGLPRLQCEGAAHCGGEDPTHLKIGTRQKFYVANYTSGSISSFDLQTEEDGCIRLVSIVSHNEEGCDSLAHAHHCMLNSAADRLYVCDLGRSTLYTYDISSNDLSLLNKFSLPEGSGPRHAVLSSCERWIFVVCELSNQVAAVPVDAATGCPVKEAWDGAMYSTLPTGDDDANMAAAEILLSRDGRFLFVSNRDVRANQPSSAAVLERSSIAVFSVDCATGALQLVQSVRSRGRHPRHMCICRDGRLLLVANRDSQNFAAFPLDPDTGLLDEAGVVVSSSAPHCVDPAFLLEVLV
jgi:6-phosphogluconolactonase